MAENQEKDLCFQPLPELSWAPEDQVDSFEKIAQYVSMEAQRAIKWYLVNKRSKKALAQLCRFLPIKPMVPKSGSTSDNHPLLIDDTERPSGLYILGKPKLAPS